jgi:cytidyltransferase-like protein
MYERDEEIAKHFSQLRKGLGWPNAFGVTFNVLHPGHLRLLRFAKECGNRLVVGVLSDRVAAHAAHVPEQLRLRESEVTNGWTRPFQTTTTSNR